MAVTSVSEVIREESGNYGDTGNASATRLFCVFTDDAADTVATVLGNGAVTLGLPSLGAAHPDISGLTVRSYSPDRIEAKYWRVEVRYSSGSDSGLNYGSDPLSISPLDMPTRVSWSNSFIDVPFTLGKLYNPGNGQLTSGKLVVTNSAGDPFDPGPTIKIPVPEVTIERNEVNTPPSILGLIGFINTNSYTLDGVTVGAGESMILDINVDPEEEKYGTTFRNVTYKIRLRSQISTLISDGVTIQHSAFDITIPDRGYNYLVGYVPGDPGASWERHRATLDDGSDSPVPAFLNGYGDLLADDPQPHNNNEVIFRVWQYPLQTSFAILNLPA